MKNLIRKYPLPEMTKAHSEKSVPFHFSAFEGRFIKESV